MEHSETEIRKRIPIRRRFLTTVLLTTILSVLLVSITGFFCISWVRRATENTLTSRLTTDVKAIMQERAGAVDAKLGHYEQYIELMKDTLSNLYNAEEETIRRGRIFYAPTDTHEYELTRMFASDTLTEADLRDEILFFSGLESLWAPIAQENKDLISTIYLGTTSGLLASYDRYSYLSATPEGQELIYNYYVSEWYERGMAQDGIIYTGVYMDSQGRGLTVTVGSNFRDRSGKTAGVICMDFDLTALYDQIVSLDPETGVSIFMLDRDQNIISPEADTLDLREYTGLTLDELDSLIADPDGIMELRNSVYVCIPMERTGWTLCASVPRDGIQNSIQAADRSIWTALFVFFGIVVMVILAAVFAVNKSVKAVTHPLELLGRDIKIISDGDLNYRAAVYRNDEIGDITSGMNEMVDRLNFTLNELMSSQQQADELNKLATRDALTSVRNKTAFDRQTELLNEEIKNGDTSFGFAMLDLNNLKLINDNYGHEKGDLYIKGLCRITCDVFAHSPVFRVGGDEFVVVLKGEDYQNIDALVTRFLEKIRASSGSRSAEPWNRVSAAIGYALYDETLDTGTETVLARADHQMYLCKKYMKGL